MCNMNAAGLAEAVFAVRGTEAMHRAWATAQLA